MTISYSRDTDRFVQTDEGLMQWVPEPCPLHRLTIGEIAHCTKCDADGFVMVLETIEQGEVINGCSHNRVEGWYIQGSTPDSPVSDVCYCLDCGECWFPGGDDAP